MANHFAFPEGAHFGSEFALGVEPGVLGDAPQRPPAGPLEGRLLVAAGVVQRGQLVEREHDVRAQPVQLRGGQHMENGSDVSYKGK